MGSVKNLKVLEKPTEDMMGLGVFEFTDDYSVFDYGKMPDTIEGKGASLCTVSSFNFEKLEEMGLMTHFVKLRKPNEMEVRLVRRILPEEGLTGNTMNCMIPLEVIFRDVLGEESSVFRRLKKGETTYQDLGLDRYPEPGEELNPPIVDFSTKYEPTDRYFKNENEVMEYSKMPMERMKVIMFQALSIDAFLRDRSNKLGWKHIDGKVEAAISPKGEVMWVDAIGTMDENRFEYKGLRLSKQILRDYYRTTPWYKEIKQAGEKGTHPSEWPAPDDVPADLLSFVSDMYKAASNSWTGHQVFDDVKTLDELIEKDYPKIKEMVKVR